MILFHGSLQIVKEPRILIPGRTLDYGAGFYTTTSEQQARDWVVRKLDVNHKIGYINIYDFDKPSAKGLDCLIFANPPGEDWVDFVHANRTQRGFIHNHDLVYGPVANDRVYAAFALYEQGLLSKQELITELRTYSLVDQMLFHTEAALKCLKFNGVKEVSL